MVNRPSRPCLTCRVLFTPTKDNSSYCTIHKPIRKQDRKVKSHYNDPEYRANRKYLIDNYGYCFRCRSRGGVGNKLEIDHIVPVHKGGSNNINNLRILCQKCHRLRHKLDN